MANYTAADIKALRDKTGAGMLDVKNALAEAEGDSARAEELLRLKGLKSIAKREGRTASAGLVVSNVDTSGDKARGIVIELNSETDFVAKNDKFIAFADSVLAAAVAAGASTVDEVLAADSEGETVESKVNAMQAAIGEKIEISNVAVVEGEHVAAYMHRTATDLPPQVGVLVATDAAGAEIAHDIAVHIAALNPSYLNRDSVPADVVENERRIAEEVTRAEGKPEQAIAKIVEGRLGGFFKQVVLLDQPYARDPKMSVGQIAQNAGATVTGFARVRVGTE
ncbi:elongation factor Ts [Flaviflexus salsibiostraticola]|uniref:Elongation factor Ts n=1 Tax=Flaviflexus salsibiostraticola TaxID=1282737 RepID=A0A3Q8WUW1_9ACTO|nr:translation elongation factor Ts [Flaviflexus salsibiostraticola]AZN29706.1 elongation factor Ts [Flaviflexus salsibiostraticola]